MQAWTRKAIEAIDCHPRTGWYIAVIVTINLLFQLFDVKL